MEQNIHRGFWWGNMKARYGRIILNGILKKQNGRA
jgi:hypothetical protein